MNLALTLFQTSTKVKVTALLMKGYNVEKQPALKKFECGCETYESYRVCHNCGGSVIKETVEPPKLSLDDEFSPYKCFESFQSFLPDINCNAGEPDFVNPNSYATIIQLIQNIGIRAGIKQYGGLREWLFVECDGFPYNILREILNNVWHCNNCSDYFYGIENFREHRCFILEQVSRPTRAFSWLVPVCGLLHLEMNACRSFIKLNWPVFTKTLGNVLGFQSPKAQEYLKKGSDHHKVWHYLEIIYRSLSLELVVPYVKECIKTKRNPTTNGYWDSCEDLEDPNYISRDISTAFCVYTFACTDDVKSR